MGKKAAASKEIRNLAFNWGFTTPLNSVRLGFGFDSFNQEIRPQVLDDSKAYQTTLAADSSSQFVVVESFAHILQVLGIGVDASASWGLVSAKAKFDFASTSEFNSYDFFALAWVRIRLPSWNLVGGSPVKSAADDSRLKPPQFFKKYGDGYISRVDYGGDLYGLLRVHCESETEKSSLKASFSGSGYGASLDVRIAQAYESMRKVSSVETILLKTGGAPSFVDQKNFVETIKAFPDEVVKTGGDIVNFGLEDFVTCNWSDTATAIEDMRKRRSDYKNLLAQIQSCEGLLADAAYITKFPDEFDFSVISKTKVVEIVRKLQQTVDSLTVRSDQFGLDPFTIATQAPVDLSEFTLPSRKRVPTPELYVQVGVLGIAVSSAGSGNWAGFRDGHALDDFLVKKASGEADIRVGYSGKLLSLNLGSLGSQEIRSSADGGAIVLDGRWMLMGVSIFISGGDAHLFNVCYQVHYRGGAVSDVVVNGAWVESPPNTNLDGLKVWIQAK